MPKLFAKLVHFIIFFNSLECFFLDFTKLDNRPVWISTQSIFMDFEIMISEIEGLINKLVRIFLFLNLFIIFLSLDLFFFKSKPPSVVISFLF